MICWPAMAQKETELDIDSRRKTCAILRILAEEARPVGSTALAAELQLLGIDLKQRMVRYYLQQMDKRGLTENLGRAGRRITQQGMAELEHAVAIDKVGFVSARVDDLAYRVSFDMVRRTGTVILNVSRIRATDFGRARRVIEAVTSAELGMGDFVLVARGGEEISGQRVPRERVAIGTVCSVTLNGVLRAAGIPTRAVFGGLLEIRDRKPFRFIQIIHYEGTTVDPVEIFIKGKMTDVLRAAHTGQGTIGASFREIPAAALPAAERVIDKLNHLGMGGVLAVGRPGRPLLDIPVSLGRVGMVVAAGLNPLAAVEESDIETENHAMSTLLEFSELMPASALTVLAS